MPNLRDNNAESPSQQADTTRVLLAVGNARQAAAIKDALQAAPTDFTISPVRRLWSAAQILAALPIDVVLLSLDLPDQHTMARPGEAQDELIGLLALTRERSDVPIIIMGGDPARGARAVAAGASAFLSDDDFTAERLEQQIASALAHQHPAASQEAPAAPSEPLPSAMKILLVEEEPLVQRLLQRNLTHQGHHVDIRSTPQDAIFWAKEHVTNLDLLICDLHPAAMDGTHLSAHLRRNFPAMRTLLLSPAHETPRARRNDSGDMFYLPKPYDFSDFQQMVETIGQQFAQDESAPRHPHNLPTSN